jgi:hypothetical protein
VRIVSVYVVLCNLKKNLIEFVPYVPFGTMISYLSILQISYRNPCKKIAIEWLNS